MFQSKLLAIFRELISFSACAAYAATYIAGILHAFIHSAVCFTTGPKPLP
jgi:hypothetical protein